MIVWIALFSWPVISMIFFKRFSLQVALCLTLLGGYLLLPNRIALDLPILPELNKDTIPALTALLLISIFAAGRGESDGVQPGWIPRDTLTRIFLLFLVFGMLGTALTNQIPLYFPIRIIQGMSLYDAGSLLLEFLVVLIPFFLGRKLLASAEGNRILLLALALSALVYSLPVIYEARMSPQLHATLYGFFPHSFAQHIRFGGFRPVVFLNHGLALAIYLLFAVIATVGLMRMSKGQQSLMWFVVLMWLLFTLVLAKSLGSLMLAAVILPVALFLKARTQMLFATCVAVFFLTYPVIRSLDLVPLDRVIAFAEQFDSGRAASLNVRVTNEERLLDRAMEKPLFGWGGWGRHRVYDAAGYDISLTDGEWVIVLGVGGWVQYIALFGLLTWPILILFFRYRDRVDTVTATLVLIMCAKLVDMLPNSGWTAAPFLVAGALIGRVERFGARQGIAADTSRPVIGYTRMGKEGSPEPAAPRQTQYARPAAEKENETGITRKPVGSGPRLRIGYKRPGSAPGYRR